MTHIMKKYLLMDGDYLKDTCYANNIKDAEEIFAFRGWITGDVTESPLIEYQYKLLYN